ncbi:calnexin homolog 1-like [Carex rostrata]
MSAKWNEHEKRVMDRFLQMATNKSKQAHKWAEPHLETAKPLFYESFEENFKGRWIVSAKEDYKGVWKYSKSNGHQDYGLLASHKERRYAIVKELKKPISLKCGTIVLQFEVRFQNGLECGGAYLKYLRPPQDARWFPKEFDNESPYSILFGPDKCHYPSGRVLFIVQHKNPKTGDFVEHHLTVPPAVPNDKLTHVYSAIITPDNHLNILIDGIEQLKPFNFLSSEDFEPPFISPNTIPDPDDKKHDDWVERAKIPDSKATKPNDCDVDAPIEIEDEYAVKPEGWLDDEPEEIDNPKWKAPKIDNLKCNEAPGCGEWKRPMKRNTAYKGKWHAPLIDNANYKGIWNPSNTPNPNCSELDFEPIKAIGIEIWTMQDGILFDNILIADDEKVAASYRETTWKPKYDVEKEKQKFDETAPHSGAPAVLEFQKMLFNLIYLIVEFSSPEEYKSRIIEFFKEFEMRPIMISGLLGLFSILLVLCSMIRVIEKEKEEKKEEEKEKKEQQQHQQPPHSDRVEVNESCEVGGHSKTVEQSSHNKSVEQQGRS